jgi:hypothetical protein
MLQKYSWTMRRLDSVNSSLLQDCWLDGTTGIGRCAGNCKGRRSVCRYHFGAG